MIKNAFFPKVDYAKFFVFLIKMFIYLVILFLDFLSLNLGHVIFVYQLSVDFQF